MAALASDGGVTVWLVSASACSVRSFGSDMSVRSVSTLTGAVTVMVDSWLRWKTGSAGTGEPARQRPTECSSSDVEQQHDDDQDSRGADGDLVSVLAEPLGLQLPDV